jgi:hypothetical protein
MLKKNQRTKPKIRKKNNNITRYKRQAKTSVTDLGLAYCNSIKDKGVTLVCTTDQKPYRMTPTIFNAMQDVEYKWNIYLGLLCRDQMRNEYLTGYWVESNEPYHHSKLIDKMNELHGDLLKQANQQHIIDFCWVALPMHKPVDESVIDQIFVNLGAWECLAQWEQKQEKSA